MGDTFENITNSVIINQGKTKRLNRQIIEEIGALSARAQSIALHNLDELEIDPDLSIKNKAIYCLMIAATEKERTAN